MSEKEQSDLKKIIEVKGEQQGEGGKIVVEDYNGEVGGAEKLPADVFSDTVAEHVQRERRKSVDETQLRLTLAILALTPGQSWEFENLKKCLIKAKELREESASESDGRIVERAAQSLGLIDIDEERG